MSDDLLTIDDIIGKKETKEIAKEYMINVVNAIRAGKVLKTTFRRYKYAPSTIKRRRKYGLQTKYVDLTGNSSYDGRSKRMLDDWTVKVEKSRVATVSFRSNNSAVIYQHHIRRYGKII